MPTARSGTQEVIDPVRNLAIGVDVGGTFTDVTIADLASGQSWSCKTATTPHNPSQGFLAAVDQALALAGAQPGEVARIVHGTTTATNAILEAQGAPTGLVTTKGFRHVLEIGRHDVPRGSNIYTWIKPARPVAPELVREVAERTLASGAVLRDLNEEDCRQAALFYRSRGIDAIAICFLNSYANPAHERRARDVMAEVHPEAWYSLSSTVLPVFREYERSMATVLNGYVMPAVSSYIGQLRDELKARSIEAPLYIMKSNGGVISAETAMEQPILTALSGPAAGVVGAGKVGRDAHFDGLISIDVGGTSADVSLIREGVPASTTEGQIGSWPLATPMIDIHTIGAGGGSIASVTDSGNLVVGPASAGAVPGPACYGRGGVRPTVTDANLALGRLPRSLAGGSLQLDVDASVNAIQEHVAGPLGISVEEAAIGILDIVNESMAGAIRVLTVERGIDPRAFALIGFGGAGPLQTSPIARLLDIPFVVLPESPGVLSTLGLIASDIRNDFASSSVAVDPLDEAVAKRFQELDADARAWLEGEGVPRERQTVQWSADLRYQNQQFEITIPVEIGPFDLEQRAGMVETFHAEHRRLYTYDSPTSPVEVVTLRTAAIGRLGGELAALRAEPGSEGPVASGTRPVYFRETGGYVECPIFERAGLSPHDEFSGPAVIDQMDTTTVVLPGQTARVDDTGNIIIQNSSGRG
ncbi:hydantoinase/oxoprolinase family protein [Dactylosporangium sp. NPDC051484]|uniref:hydantoinase/oxoprolinase family protein n=1 Tax=Dactylosporangium sp. NPDC051484 TaxID=3154942 RepID=UPI0034503B3C